MPYPAVFISELDSASHNAKDSDGPFTVTTVTGLALNRIWIIGTLTSYTPLKRNGMIRIADPTGVLTLHIKFPLTGMNIQPSDLIPPLFLSITAYGEGDTDPDNAIRWMVETSRIVTRQERDTWIQVAADTAYRRLLEMHTAIQSGRGSERLLTVKTLYNLEPKNLQILAEQIKKALEVIKDPEPPVPPSELILLIIKQYSGPKGLNIEDIYRYTRRSGLSDEEVRDTIRTLVAEDEVYQPSPGYIKLL